MFDQLNSGPFAGEYGEFKNISREDYQLKMNQVSQSWLKYFDWEPSGGQSPANFYFENLDPLGPGRKMTDALLFGDAFHTRILEPAEFIRRVVWWSETKTTNSKGYREAVKAMQQGQMLIPEDWRDQLDGMFESLRNNRDARDLLTMPGDNELTLLWKDDTGIDCKSRLDRRIPEHDLIVDLKTTRDASKTGFQKSVMEYDYHVQDFSYRKGYEKVYGRPPAQFAFINVEKEPPFLTSVYYLDEEAVKKGEYLFNNRISRFEECFKAQKFPGYQEKPAKVGLPEWYHRKIENGEI